jgi:murein lipoprotein
MRHFLTTLTAASVLALTACANQPASTTSAPSAAAAQTQAPAQPAISAEAQAALTSAEVAVKDAKAKNALWTTAETAIKAAEEAAKTGDSEAVMKNAKTAEQQARLGLEQAKGPALELKNL